MTNAIPRTTPIISGRLLAKNSLINLIGYAIPVFFVILATPYIVRGFGTDRYGLLSLTWVILGYFTLFDLGLGPAVTKYVAELAEKTSKDEVSGIVWTTVFVQGVLGVVGGLILAAIIPYLTNYVFAIPPRLIPEAKTAFYITAFYIPVTLISGSFTGVLAAAQRFDLINLTKIPAQLSLYIAGMAGVYFQWSISTVVATILLTRIVTALIQMKMATVAFPQISQKKLSLTIFKKIARYGGWITLSNFVNPLMFYVDRLLIGVILGMSALTFYTIPFDLAARLWIISTSMTMTLFPAFSSLAIDGHNERIIEYFVNFLKALTLLSGPVVCVLLAFSREILCLWVGAELADRCTVVFRVLLISTIIDYADIISTSFLEGSGRVKEVALTKAIYLPLHVLVTAVLLKFFNIVGAAMAIFALRVVYSTVFSNMSVRALGCGYYSFIGRLLPCYGVTVGFVILSVTGWYLNTGLRVAFEAVLACAFLIAAWRWAINGGDKGVIRALVRQMIGGFRESCFRRRLQGVR